MFPDLDSTNLNEENIQDFARKQIQENIFESLRVLLKEFTIDSTLDIKEKAKVLLKTIN